MLIWLDKTSLLRFSSFQTFMQINKTTVRMYKNFSLTCSSSALESFLSYMPILYLVIDLSWFCFVLAFGNERKPVVALTGTIPVNYRGTTYNIPIAVYILETHPYHPPICHVKPTSDMTIKQSQHVDATGRIYLPYLHEWKHVRNRLYC